MISIAHRDMKPQNILVDQFKHKAIICDFGSAKKLVKSNKFKYFQPKLIQPIFAQDAIELLN